LRIRGKGSKGWRKDSLRLLVFCGGGSLASVGEVRSLLIAGRAAGPFRDVSERRAVSGARGSRAGCQSGRAILGGGSLQFQAVGGAQRAGRAVLEDVGVDLGGSDAAVAEELLDGSDVGAVFEQVGGERVAQGMAGRALGDAGVSFALA
jgi:hypothetical protein